MAMYCTVDQVRDVGRLDIDGTDYDVSIGDYIVTVSTWIDQYTVGVADAFRAATSTVRYFNGDAVHGKTLALDRPLVSVTSVTNADVDTTAITGSEYWLMPRNESPYCEILLKSTAAWEFDTDAWVEVDAVWGYSTAPPAPVAEACAMMSGWLLKRYQSALQDATANFDMGELVYSSELPKQIKPLLEPYRRGWMR